MRAMLPLCFPRLTRAVWYGAGLIRLLRRYRAPCIGKRMASFILVASWSILASVRPRNALKILEEAAKPPTIFYDGFVRFFSVSYSSFPPSGCSPFAVWVKFPRLAEAYFLWDRPRPFDRTRTGYEVPSEQ